MRILDRYVLRGFLVNYVIALTVMIGLYVVIDLFFNIDEFSGDQKRPFVETARRILDFYGYNMPLYFVQLSGVITVVAACATLARMHRVNELTAVLASGTSLYRVAWPVILAGLGMNLLWVLDQELLIPRIAPKLARPHADIEGNTVYPVWFVPDRDRALLSARRFLPSAGELRGLTVVFRDEQGRLVRILRADAARWDPARKAWALTLGIEEHPGRESADGTPSHEGRDVVSYYESDLTPDGILIQQASQWTNFLSLREIESVQRRFPNDAAFVKVKHARITTPFVNLILLLMGIRFFLTRERVSLVVAGGWCILVCGGCFVLTFFAQNVDFSALGTGPALPVWLPVLIFTPVAVWMFDGLKT